MNINDILNKLDEWTTSANTIYPHFKQMYITKHYTEFMQAHDSTYREVLKWYNQRDKVFDRYAHIVFINNSGSGK
jgi:hypothetical protein